MDIIRFNNPNDVITIEITITGLVTWRYVYADHGTKYVRASTDAPPYLHALGFSHELDGHFNSWDVQMANTTDKNQDYTASIVWKQGTTELFTWMVNGTIAPGSGKVESSDCRLTT